jgi:hypothetical protein
MNPFVNPDRVEMLEALRRERARQDEQLTEAFARLRAHGDSPLAVPRRALAAIDAACLAPAASLTPTALRG